MNLHRESIGPLLEGFGVFLLNTRAVPVRGAGPLLLLWTILIPGRTVSDIQVHLVPFLVLAEVLDTLFQGHWQSAPVLLLFCEGQLEFPRKTLAIPLEI